MTTTPHCTGSVAPVGFNSTEVQTQMLSFFWHGPACGGGGAGGGQAINPGFGVVAVIADGGTFEAFITVSTAPVTDVMAGNPVAPAPHVAHVARAALIAPCCAAC